MKALEALYYGIINSPDYDIQDENEYQHLLKLVVRNEADLSDTLTDAQKDTFEKFKDCVDELHTITDIKAFTNGFVLATKIMTEVMMAS